MTGFSLEQYNLADEVAARVRTERERDHWRMKAEEAWGLNKELTEALAACEEARKEDQP